MHRAWNFELGFKYKKELLLGDDAKMIKIERTSLVGRDLTTQKVYDFYQKYYKSTFVLSSLDWMRFSLNTMPIEFLKNKIILDAASGGGENACAMARYAKKVVCVDIASNRLKDAQRFANKIHIDNIEFCEGDILTMKYENEFDYVLCASALMHTVNPELGFKNLVNACKHKGYVSFCLYNKYGSIYHEVLKKLLHTFSHDKKTLLKNIRLYYRIISPIYKRFSYEMNEETLMDIYNHPNEKYTTISEIFRWFDKYNCKYIGSYLPLELNRNFIILMNILKNLNKKNFNWDNINPPLKKGLINPFIIQTIWFICHIRMSGYSCIKE